MSNAQRWCPLPPSGEGFRVGVDATAAISSYAHVEVLA